MLTPFNSLTVDKPDFSKALRNSGSFHMSSVTPPSGIKSKASSGNKSVQLIGKTSISLLISNVSSEYKIEVDKVRHREN